MSRAPTPHQPIAPLPPLPCPHLHSEDVVVLQGGPGPPAVTPLGNNRGPADVHLDGLLGQLDRVDLQRQ